MTISAVCGVLSAIIVALSTRHSFIMGAFFLLGISASGQSIAFALIAEQFKKGNIALAFGLNNAMISTASALIAPLMGWMLDYSKAGCDASIYDYYFAFSVIVFLLVTSLLVSVFFIAETYCKSAVEFTYLKPTPSKR